MRKKLVDDRYRIVSRIGQGAMGMVFKAEHVYTRRPVALKVIHSQYQQNEMYRTRFLREIELACRVQHPNAVQILDAGEVESHILYMAMEYLDGHTLSQLLTQHPGGLDLRTTLHIANQIGRALDAVHAAGLVHRDLKPDNIMVLSDAGAPPESCTVKILDFGIARDVDSLHSLTGKRVIGTPKFMSPEQTRGEKLTRKSDIYNLGLIVYAMLTGKEPFSSDSPVGYVFHHNLSEPAPVSSLRDDVPAYVEQAIQKALSKNPADRFDSAADFIDALSDAGAGASASSPAYIDAKVITAVDREPAPSEKRRISVPWKKLIPVGIVGAVCLLGLATISPQPSDAPARTIASTSQEIIDHEPADTMRTTFRDVDSSTIVSTAGDLSTVTALPGADTTASVVVAEPESVTPEAPAEDLAPAREIEIVDEQEEIDPNLRYYTNYRVRHVRQRGDAAGERPIEENSNIRRLRERQRLEIEARETSTENPAPHALPSVRGGVASLQSLVRFPVQAGSESVSGTVGVRVLIDENGEIRDQEIVKSVGFGYDEEVLRVLQNATFEPARVYNRPVKAWMTLNFRFQNG